MQPKTIVITAYFPNLRVIFTPMNTLFLDCSFGISGDMTVASLIDAGADIQVLQKVLNSIPVQGFKTEITTVMKNGIALRDFNVILEQDNHDHDMEYLFGEGLSHHHEHHEHCEGYNHHEHGEEHEHHHEHRGLKEILEIIDKTQMTEGAKNLAKKIFDILADAESKAHAKPKDQVHFHEVGALDSIVDIIAMATCFDNLDIGKVYSTPLQEGSGTIRCAHGILNIPVPAVANIVAAHKIPLSIKNEQGELVTPTGAAFVAAIADTVGISFEPPQNFTIQKIGLGAGKRAYSTPSMLRATLIKENSQTAHDTIIKLECNIDDCTGENMGFIQELLLAEGAKDVITIPCYMKKNRPGFLLQVLCANEDTQKLETLIFKHTTTIGIRRCQMERTTLPRRAVEMDTPYGKVLVKEVVVEGETRLYPEYESVKKICLEQGIGFVEVMKNMVKH